MGLGRLLGIGLFALAISVGQAQTFGQEAISQADPSKDPRLNGVKLEQHPGVRLPMRAVFREDDGRPVAFGSLFRGRPIVLLPIFYRCTGVCNLELQSVLNALVQTPKLVPGRDLEVVTLGINPKETPELAHDKKVETLTEYKHPETGSGWHFLTGSMDSIRSITDAMGFRFTYDPTQNIINHPSGVMVLTPDGRVSSYMLRGTYPIDEFQDDVERARHSEIAPPSEDICLGCIHVDRITGKRSLVILGVMRLLAACTVLALVATILGLSIRNRTKSVGRGKLS
jgi:protein SCO1/2